MKRLKWFTRLLLLLLVAVFVAVSTAMISNQVPFMAAPGPSERLTVYLSENRIVTSDQARFPELRTPYYEVAPRVAFQAVTAAIADLGWEVVDINAEDGRAHAIATTPWLKFQDDVTIQVREEEPELIALQVVAQSRIGQADLGANLRHWLNFRHRFEQQLRRRPYLDEETGEATADDTTATRDDDG